MPDDSQPHEPLNYQPIPRNLEGAGVGSRHLGLLLGFVFCLGVWAAIGMAVWLYVRG